MAVVLPYSKKSGFNPLEDRMNKSNLLNYLFAKTVLSHANKSSKTITESRFFQTTSVQ